MNAGWNLVETNKMVHYKLPAFCSLDWCCPIISKGGCVTPASCERIARSQELSSLQLGGQKWDEVGSEIRCLLG